MRSGFRSGGRVRSLGVSGSVGSGIRGRGLKNGSKEED